VLPIEFEAGEKRTHDYVRHGTTNLFAALNVTAGEVFGECKPTRNGANFLAFLKKAVQPHSGRDIHVVLDNLSHTPRRMSWPGWSATRTCISTSPRSARPGSTGSRPGSASSPVSPSGGTFTSVTALVKQIRDYIDHWNTDPKPFTWTATADEILAKVQLVQTSIKKLVDNNAQYMQRNYETLVFRDPVGFT
jgi:hypothetical protein